MRRAFANVEEGMRPFLADLFHADPAIKASRCISAALTTTRTTPKDRRDPLRIRHQRTTNHCQTTEWMALYANGKSGPIRAETSLPRSRGSHCDWIHKMKKIAFLLASMGLAAAAQGATISFTYGLPIVQATTEINQTGLLGLFNPALGTLTGASLTYQSAATTSISLTNTAAQNQNARAASTMEILWTSTIASLSPLLATPAMTMSFSTGPAQSYTPGQSRTFGGLTDSDSITQNLNSILASFVGVGTFGLNCESLTGLTVTGGGGNVRGSQSTTAGCGAEIVYTYTPTPTRTPEPGSLALVGMAAVGLGVAARRRKA